MEPSPFQILYECPRFPVPEKERYETWDVESAFYDYLPAAARATLKIGAYTLELDRLMFVDWVRHSLPLAERIAGLLPDPNEALRSYFPDAPPSAKLFSWTAADAMIHLPVIVFAVDGDRVSIYTRTHSESSALIVMENRDLKDPVVAPRGVIVKEIVSTLTRYLDDLAAAFPFLDADEKYREYRDRIARLN
jgi:hypothetical protein